jgi:hypothetical protein
VFQAAAIGLAIAAPMLGGPLAAAAVAAGGAMQTARVLFAAKQHLARGNVAAARTLIAHAKQQAASPAITHVADHIAKKADTRSGPALAAYGNKQAKKKVYALLLQPAA